MFICLWLISVALILVIPGANCLIWIHAEFKGRFLNLERGRKSMQHIPREDYTLVLSGEDILYVDLSSTDASPFLDDTCANDILI